MTTIAAAAESFLAHRRIAVTGVSRHPEGHGSNTVFQRLIERGYDAVPINPHADAIDGITAYPDLRSVPGGVEAVVIGTHAKRALATVKEASALGIGEVWMHRAFGDGSVDAEATAWGREHGMTVIDGGCPLMFAPTADGFHRFMCPWLQMRGKVPREV